MSEKKTIQINPDLFKFPEKDTRKKHPKISAPKIQMKSNLKKQKQKSLRRNVLKMIREKQQDEYKRLFDKSSVKSSNSPLQISSSKEFDKDFSDSLEFFSSLANKPENQTDIHNKTFKKYPNDRIVPTQPLFINTNENVNLEFPDISPNIELTPRTDPVSMPYIPQTGNQMIEPHTKMPLYPRLPPPPMPKYGCLKNGSLPTYRILHNNTQRQYPQMNTYYPSQVVPSQVVPSQVASYPFTFLEENVPSNTPLKTSEIVQKYNKKQNAKNKIKYLKQKKIFKRTYCVGRSKTKPQIGVLVSNRTIRNRISTQSQLLKQTPIQDVRKFLIKKGFIKIGTNSPNDVLRKMYESVSLVCGEIENHNPENLLFNFIHDTHQ